MKRAKPSVRGQELVSRIGRTVNEHEEPLHVPVQPALTYLVRLDINERVMTSFRLNGKAHDAQCAAIGTAPSLRCRFCQPYAREEFVGDVKYFGGGDVRAMEMAHGPYGMTSRSFFTSCIQSMRSSFRVESRRNWIAIAHSPDVTKLSFA
jgi:hypothetical protein